MEKTILINPPLYFSGGLPYSLDVSVPPLGILYLASYINKYADELKAEVMDVTVENLSLDKIYQRIKNVKPLVVGISSMTPQLQGAVELAGFLKKNFPRTKIFLGGSHMSADPDFINRFRTIFDYGVIGEAEITFLKSVLCLLKGKKIPRIQTGKPVVNLDTIPFPDKRLIKREKYQPYESMIFLRGCPYYCYFCSRPAIDKKIRYRSVGNLLEEIKSNYQYSQGKIDFQDDTFTLNKKRVFEFCEAVRKKNLKLNWRCNTRVDLVNEELLYQMKKSGCSLVHFGIESGSEKVRKNIINKGNFSNKRIDKIFKICQELEIKVGGYFMLGHPGETKRELGVTRKMILTLPVDLLGLSVPTPFPGSKLFEIAKKEGIASEKIIDKFARKELGEGYAGNYPVYISKKLSREYLYSLMKEINRKFYLNWQFFWRRLKDDLFSWQRLKKDFKDFLSILLKGVSSRKPYVN